MKFTYLVVCALVVLAVVQAKPLAVKQGFDFLAFMQSIAAAVGEVAGTIVAAVVTPILQVVAIVEEKIVAPINNKVTSTALGLAINQFCGMLPTLVAPLGFTLPANSKDICIGAAKEELRKGFDSSWTEPARE